MSQEHDATLIIDQEYAREIEKLETWVNPFEAPEGNIPLLFNEGPNPLNVHKNKIIHHVKRNIRLHLPQMDCHMPTDRPVALVAGGWSLDETFDELRDLYFDGVPLVALNGAGNWLMERNIRPAMQVVMDAREDNRVFVETPIPHCRYFLASQCHPSLFEACKDRETFIFHIRSCGEESREEEILNEYYNENWRHIPGGGTVGVRSISIMRILGYQLIHVFGLDSCLSPTGKNHAYKQEFNASDKKVLPVWIGPHKFECSGWHAIQAHQFKQYIENHGEHFSLQVHGNGLIAQMMRLGASAYRTTEEG